MTEQPERCPLRAPWGEKIGDTSIDGYRVLRPGDEGDEDAYYHIACRQLQYGWTMPCADEAREVE